MREPVILGEINDEQIYGISDSPFGIFNCTMSLEAKCVHSIRKRAQKLSRSKLFLRVSDKFVSFSARTQKHWQEQLRDVEVLALPAGEILSAISIK